MCITTQDATTLDYLPREWLRAGEICSATTKPGYGNMAAHLIDSYILAILECEQVASWTVSVPTIPTKERVKHHTLYFTLPLT